MKAKLSQPIMLSLKEGIKSFLHFLPRRFLNFCQSLNLRSGTRVLFRVLFSDLQIVSSSLVSIRFMNFVAFLENRSGQYVWEDHSPRSGMWKGTNGGEVISFSGCDDDQTSADTAVSFTKPD